MRLDYFSHAFDAVIEHHDLGTYRYTVVFLPDALAAALPLAEHPRLRISGEIDDHAFTGAWQPSRGRWYLMLGKPLLRATALEIGSFAHVRFRVEPQDEVDVPAELQRAVAADAAAQDRWNGLTAGKQRALAFRVASAKTAVTRNRRVIEVVDWLASGETDLRWLGKT